MLVSPGLFLQWKIQVHSFPWWRQRDSEHHCVNASLPSDATSSMKKGRDTRGLNVFTRASIFILSSLDAADMSAGGIRCYFLTLLLSVSGSAQHIPAVYWWSHKVTRLKPLAKCSLDQYGFILKTFFSCKFTSHIYSTAPPHPTHICPTGAESTSSVQQNKPDSWRPCPTEELTQRINYQYPCCRLQTPQVTPVVGLTCSDASCRRWIRLGSGAFGAQAAPLKVLK